MKDQIVSYESSNEISLQSNNTYMSNGYAKKKKKIRQSNLYYALLQAWPL